MELTQLLYIDPAATSVLISSLTAIVVAVGASAIVIWRRMKKKIDTTLNKDPNANKEVEDELVINEEATSETETVTEASATPEATTEETAPVENAATETPTEEVAKPKTTKKKTK